MGEKNREKRQALYRRYRSRSLEEVKGQEHITKTLKNAVAKDHINHAYLFTGPRGTGKTSVARILAHEINQLAYQSDNPHLDIIEIDAASNRRIDDIRDLREKVQIAPTSAKYKVYIIDEVHMLTTESFNALLKTLEEPPSHVIFILATTEVHKLPATIISRSQRHSFRYIPKHIIAEHLRFIADQESINISHDAIDAIAEHGNGSFRDSISMLDQVNNQQSRIELAEVEQLLGVAPQKVIEQLFTDIKNGQISNVLRQTKQLFDEGLTAGAISTQLAQHSRMQLTSSNMLWIANLLESLLEVPRSNYPDLKLESLLVKISLSNQADVLDRKEKLSTSLKNSTAQPKIATKQTNSPKINAAESIKGGSDSILPAEDLPRKSNIKPQDDLTDELILNAWTEILQILKTKNNSLYTIMRLAQPRVKNDNILLTFQFAFHQKRIESITNKQTVTETMQEVLGYPIEIATAVDPKSKPQKIELPDKPADPAHASLIGNIQAMMGGGEVINEQ